MGRGLRCLPVPGCKAAWARQPSLHLHPWSNPRSSPRLHPHGESREMLQRGLNKMQNLSSFWQRALSWSSSVPSGLWRRLLIAGELRRRKAKGFIWTSWHWEVGLWWEISPMKCFWEWPGPPFGIRQVNDTQAGSNGVNVAIIGVDFIFSLSVT